MSPSPHIAAPSAPEGRSPRRPLLRWIGWFGVANTFVLMLVSLRNLMVVDAPEGLPASVFGLLMIVGHHAFVAFVPCVVPLALVLVRPSPRLVIPAGTLLAVASVITGLIDTVIFQQYRFHLNAEIFNLLFGGAAGEILVFTTAMYLQTALALALLFAAEGLLARWVWKRIVAGRGFGPGRLVAGVLVACFLSQAVLHAWADTAGYTPITRQGRVLLGYVPFTAEKLFRRLGFDVQRVAGGAFDHDHGTNLAYPLHPLACTPRENRPNLLFIVIDGWRRDSYDESITPNLWKLDAESLVFTDHFSGGSATRTGIFAMFYAIPGTYWHAMLSERRGPVFVDELQRQGYEIEIFASAKLVNPEFDRTVFADVPDLRLRSDGDGPSARDIDLTDDFVDFLERRSDDRPFFSMLFYDAPHGYDVPDDFPQPFQPSWDKVNYLALNPDFDPTPFRNRYLNCVRFDDDLAGRALDALERAGLAENTIVVVTGDHGQEFNDNGLNYWGHDSNFSAAQVAVPLVIRWPGRAPQVIDYRTSHYDLVPTFAEDVLGCTNDPADYSVGRNLLQPGGREALLLANYTDYAIVQPDRIVAVYPYGVEVLGLDYRPIPGAEPDGAVTLHALRDRSRFYR